MLVDNFSACSPTYAHYQVRTRYTNVPTSTAFFVFAVNRSFYPTTSPVHPVSVLILHPTEIQILWSQTAAVGEKTKEKILIELGK